MTKVTDSKIYQTLSYQYSSKRICPEDYDLDTLRTSTESTVIDKREHWRKISEIIFNYLSYLKLHPINIYLVGSSSRVNRTKESGDIDSLILIKDELPLEYLKHVRLQVDKYLSEIGGIGIYHFKLFNEREIKLLGLYDGFRLFEFHFSNVPMLNATKITDFNYVLNISNFCNSLFIQMVYEFLSNDMNVSLKDAIIASKIRERITRNKEILSSLGKQINLLGTDVINILKKRDKLFTFFWDIRNKAENVNSKATFWFMHRYFSRFRHEYINKYYYYMNKIKRRLKNENKTTIF